MPTSRTEQLAHRLPRPESDTWVRFFESSADWALKQDFLARGLVDLDASPDRPTQILDACVRRHANAPTSWLVGGTDVPVIPPSTLDVPWPAASGSEDGEALLHARLVALGGLPFATPERPGPDLLEVALRKRWRGVVLRMLGRPDVPDARDLQGRRSDLKFGKKPLPWAHALSFLDRTDELKAWLSQPGMDVNAVDDQGKTALFYARTPRVVELLCACGADPGWVSPDGRNAPAQWENPPSAYDGFMDPRVLKALKATLLEAGGNPQDAILERVHRWAKAGPEEWARLSDSVQEEMRQLRVSVANSGAADGNVVEWGMIGYLGLHLSDHHFSDASGHKRKLSWGNFSRSVPQELLDHESVPGVPAGWVLLAGIYHQTMARYVYNPGDETNRVLVNLWSDRLLKNTSGADRPRHWRMGMLKATGALLERFGVGDPKNFGALVWDVVGDHVTWLGEGAPSPALRREISATLLCTRVFHRVLALGLHTMRAVLEEGLDPPWTEGASPTELWSGMLGLYREVARREEKYEPSERFRKGTHALEKVMRGWLKQRHVPTGLQEGKTRGGLAILAKRQPDVRSALLADRLEKSVKEAPATQRRRPRM